MKHKRTRKPDNFTDPHAVGSTTLDAIHHATKPLDKIATDMERKWGVDRLPSLVSPETAAKFGSAKARLDASLDGSNVDEAVKRLSVMVRAWKALDEEAERNHEPLVADVWTVIDDCGEMRTIARSTADATKYIREGGKGKVYSTQEVVRILDSWEKQNDLTNVIKAEFPGSEIVSIKETLDDELDF